MDGSYFQQLSNQQLVAEIESLANVERASTATLIECLEEFDRRNLFLAEGFSSLFGYCTQRLRLCEYSAYARIQIARAARRFPAIVDALRDGRLTLTSAILLVPHLTEDNHLAVLAEAAHKRKEDIKVIVARLKPRPAAATVIRKAAVRPVPSDPSAAGNLSHPDNSRADTAPMTGAAPSVTGADGPGPSSSTGGPSLNGADLGATGPGGTSLNGADPRTTSPDGTSLNGADPRATSPDGTSLNGTSLSATDLSATSPSATSPSATSPSATRTSATRTTVVTPLAPDVYKVQLTISGEARENLRELQDLMRHSIPNGDAGLIFERAIALLLDDIRKKKLGVVARPRGAVRPMERGSRSIPAHVRRAVNARDQGQCAFIGAQGRCPERGFLEFHHIVPFAMGGAATKDNIALRCRAHNGYEWRAEGARV